MVVQFNHVRIVRFTGSFLVDTPTAVFFGSGELSEQHRCVSDVWAESVTRGPLTRWFGGDSSLAEASCLVMALVVIRWCGGTVDW